MPSLVHVAPQLAEYPLPPSNPFLLQRRGCPQVWVSSSGSSPALIISSGNHTSLSTSIPPPASSLTQCRPPLQPSEPSTPTDDRQNHSVEVGSTVITSLLLASMGPGGVIPLPCQRRGRRLSDISPAQRPVSTWCCAGRSRGARAERRQLH